MSDTFRHVPPAVRSGWIDRPRLAGLLGRRFELDVLTMVAPAGYGKTTALSQALARNRVEVRGADLWVQCEPRDRDPEVLGAAILTAAGRAPVGGSVVTAQVVADVLLRFAPEPVCVVLDDVHVLGEDSPAVGLLGEVLERLPTHGHLLLSGRSMPPLRLARRRAQGRVGEIGVEDLAFDDEEIDLALPGHGDDVGGAARWPAMSSLLANGSASDTVDYLLEEVAAALGEERLAALTALAHVRSVDDGIAGAASGGVFDAPGLLGDLPLVQRNAHGVFQMHDLWLHALAPGDLEPSAGEALGRVAEHLLASGRYLDAAEQFAAAGDPDGVERTAAAYACQPLMFVSAADLRHMAGLSTKVVVDRPITAVLNATVATVGDERSSAEAFEAAARAARAAGDARVEALALKNAVNMRGVIEPFAFPAWLRERADALVEADGGDPIRLSLQALLASHACRAAGEPEEAARHLGRLNPTVSVMDRVQHAFGMSDLGRPEEVATPTVPEEATAAAAQAGGQYLAQAIWLRGEVSPELALALGRGLAEATDAREVPHVQISTNAVLCFVAAAAGDGAEARRFADRSARWVGHTASEYVRSFAGLADAVALLGERGEEAAVARLAAVLAAVPVAPWPFRSYLYAIPFIYVLAPGARAVLDGCRFGPALTAAQEAGQALVALRERNDPKPARALAWHRPWLLRAHVLPPHLGQLAAAAAAAGHGEVGEVLEQLPSAREHLVGAAGLDHTPTALWARGRVDGLPARPGHDVAVTVLGPVTATRGTTAISDEPWVRRERVRQLLAFLLLHRRVSRLRAAEELWPELPIDRALPNLRVNLNHLQRVLQPDRDPGDKPWFVRSDQETIEITPVGFDVDAERFDGCCEDARRLDEAAQGTRAIARYREAAGLFAGDYLAEWPEADWAVVERVRLRTLATGAMSRLGELLLARGEPEEATAWAGTVLRYEPLLERAHRLFVRSLAGQGNRPAALTAAQDLSALLTTEGLTPEPESRRLIESLGGTPPR